MNKCRQIRKSPVVARIRKHSNQFLTCRHLAANPDHRFKNRLSTGRQKLNQICRRRAQTPKPASFRSRGYLRPRQRSDPSGRMDGNDTPSSPKMSCQKSRKDSPGCPAFGTNVNRYQNDDAQRIAIQNSAFTIMHVNRAVMASFTFKRSVAIWIEHPPLVGWQICDRFADQGPTFLTGQILTRKARFGRRRRMRARTLSGYCFFHNNELPDLLRFYNTPSKPSRPALRTTKLYSISAAIFIIPRGYAETGVFKPPGSDRVGTLQTE